MVAFKSSAVFLAATCLVAVSSLPVRMMNSTEAIVSIVLGQSGNMTTNVTVQSTAFNGTFANATVCQPLMFNSSISQNWTMANMTTLSKLANLTINGSRYSIPANITILTNVTCNLFNGTIANATIERSQNLTAFIVSRPVSSSSSISSIQSTPDFSQEAAAVTTSSEVTSSSTPAAERAAAVQSQSSSTFAYVAPSPTTTSSSIYVAPTPITSTSIYVAPTITSTSTYAPANAVAADTGGSGTFSGPATYYATGLGACGVTNTDTDYIAAAAWELFDSFPSGGNTNNSPICNKRAVVTGPGGATITVAITDRCAGCDNKYALDFSPSAFEALVAGSTMNSNTGLGIGRVPAVSCKPTS